MTEEHKQVQMPAFYYASKEECEMQKYRHAVPLPRGTLVGTRWFEGPGRGTPPSVTTHFQIKKR